MDLPVRKLFPQPPVNVLSDTPQKETIEVGHLQSHVEFMLECHRRHLVHSAVFFSNVLCLLQRQRIDRRQLHRFLHAFLGFFRHLTAPEKEGQADTAPQKPLHRFLNASVVYFLHLPANVKESQDDTDPHKPLRPSSFLSGSARYYGRFFRIKTGAMPEDKKMIIPATVSQIQARRRGEHPMAN